jgi:hypothetical protein
MQGRAYAVLVEWPAGGRKPRPEIVARLALRTLIVARQSKVPTSGGTAPTEFADAPDRHVHSQTVLPCSWPWRSRPRMKSMPFATRGPLLRSRRPGRRARASPRRFGQHQISKMAEHAELDLFRQAVNLAPVLERIVGC